MKTHETKNWSELAMILTARLRLQYICTGAADKRCAAFLMEIMQRSGEADPAAALSYMVMADSAAGDDVLRYWTALYERGRITEDGALEAACRHGIFISVFILSQNVRKSKKN